MQVKKLLVLIGALTLLAACDVGSAGKSTATAAATPAKPVEIALTEDELKIANGNSNAVAQILVRKAILSEMKANPFTPEEIKVLDSAKENLEIEFYLDKEAQKTINVSGLDVEVLKVYESNKDKLENSDPEVVMPQLKQALIQQKVGAEKVNLINGLIAKYNLNDILKKYVPQATEVPASTGTEGAGTAAPAAETSAAPQESNAATPPATTETKPAETTEEKKN